jgi:hypothetical protein
MSRSRLHPLSYLIATACTCLHAAVELDCAYFHVDLGGKYSWTEGAPGLADFAKTDRRAGTLKVYVRNNGTAPAKVEALALNGVALEQLRTNEKHEVIWWRTWPDPVPAKGFAEISVRLRYPLEADAALTLETDGKPLEVTVPAKPPSFRIETVAWRNEGKEVFLVAEQLRPEGTRVTKVLLDGVEVTKRARILAPGFFGGICPVTLTPPAALQRGSFHTYKLVAANGEAVACTLRTLDEFLRLGMYGAGDLERNLKLGINCAAHFRPLDRETLDRYATFGQRSAFHVNADAPDPEVRGHPAVHAYLLRDEPDCWDYGADEWPAALRIGFHGPDLVRHTQQCVEADPAKPVMVTLDLTFKPANYYVYAQLPDIVAPDCYPLSIGVPLAWVREVTETCRKAAGPRRVETIPQVDFEDRHKVEMKFRRPPFPREVIIQYLYALGAGARGFSGWEWFDEKSDFADFHGAPNYPDVLDAVGQVYRRFALVSPLILQAHPTALATCSDKQVWVKTLVCGGDALLLVVVNDDYECLPNDFSHHPKREVEIRLPSVPWLKTGYAAKVDDGLFSPLTMASGEEATRLTLPQLDTGAVVLVAADERVARDLLQRYGQHQAEAGLALLRGSRRDDSERARADELTRLIVGRYAQYAVEVSKPLAAYGVEQTGFWNPTRSKYPGLEWWTDATPRGGEWKVTIPEAQAGKRHTVYFQLERWWNGGYLRVEVAGPDGKLLFEKDRPTWDGPIPNFTVGFPQAGEYVLRLLDAGEGKPAGRLARTLFVVPETAEGLGGSAW